LLRQKSFTRDRRARYLVVVVMICSGDYSNLERARVMAADVFGGEFVSPLAPSRGSAEATFRVRPDSRRQANAFFEWMAQQHRAGRLTSCQVVELDFLIDGHVIAGRSV
jgi:hypothetical protein